MPHKKTSRKATKKASSPKPNPARSGSKKPAKKSATKSVVKTAAGKAAATRKTAAKRKPAPPRKAAASRKSTLPEAVPAVRRADAADVPGSSPRGFFVLLGGPSGDPPRMLIRQLSPTKASACQAAVINVPEFRFRMTGDQCEDGPICEPV